MLRIVPLALVAAVLWGGSAGCSLFDPTYDMTPAEKEAYEKEQRERRERRAQQEAEFERLNVKSLDVPGDGHEEARDAALAGRYECKMTFPVADHNFVIKKQDAIYKKHKRLHLFPNGSFVEVTYYDVYESTDGKNQMGVLEETWRRGMWKTDGQTISTRRLGVGGHGPWVKLGDFDFRQDGPKRLLVVGKEPQSALEAFVAGKNEDGSRKPSEVDIWISF